MGIFFDILSSINNPNQQGSVSQLESINNSIQQLANSHNINPSQMQNVLSALSTVLRPALQQQRATVGESQLGDLVGQVLGSGGLTASSSLITPQLQQQIAQAVSQRTGLSSNLIQTILPTLIPAVLALLSMGAPKSGVPASNSVLNSFLDGDRDGDIDLGDAMNHAMRFLK